MRITPSSRSSARYLVTTVIIVSGLGLLVLWPMLLDPYIQTDDFRNLYEVHRLLDPAALPHIPHGNLELASGTYYVLLAAVSRLTTPLLAGKVIGLLLLLIGSFFAYQLANEISGPTTALVTAIVYAASNLASGSEVGVIFGLQRSFITPLLLALLYFLATQRYAGGAIVVAFSGLIYIPAFPVAAIAYGLSAVDWERRKGIVPSIRWERMVFLLPVLLLVVVVQLPLIMSQLEAAQPTTVQSAFDSAHILDNPVYEAGGRRALFFLFPLVGRGGLVTNGAAALQLLLLLITAVVTRLVLGRDASPLPAAAWNLFWASVIAFALSWLAILVFSSFLLYVPSRHTQSSFFVLLVLYVSINVRQTLVTLAARARESRRWLGWLAIPALLLPGAVVLVLPHLHADGYASTPWLRYTRWLLLGLTLVLAVLIMLLLRRAPSARATEPRVDHGNVYAARLLGNSSAIAIAALYVYVLAPETYVPSADRRALFQFVQTLPADALFAGDPCSLDDIPFYARRSVVFNCERYDGDELIMDSIRAYYAVDASSLASYCQSYKVDFLVVNTKTLTTDSIAERTYFFAPYTERLASELAGRNEFYLAELLGDHALFQRGDLGVVTCPAEPVLEH